MFAGSGSGVARLEVVSVLLMKVHVTCFHVSWKAFPHQTASQSRVDTTKWRLSIGTINFLRIEESLSPAAICGAPLFPKKH
jgi:hypothetical protein